MKCFDDEGALDVLRRRRLDDPTIQAHLDGCAACRELIALAVRATSEDAADGTMPLDGGDREAAHVDLYPGEIVDFRYAVETCVGRGGMGTVWSARRLDSGMRVALKVIQLADEETLKRVEREVRVAETLRHPNIVPIHEVLPPSGQRGPILVMDFLEGETWRDALTRDRAYSLRDTARLLLPVVSAIEAAHAQNFVHRDLKPENIFRTKEGHLYVLDFGIAGVLSTTGFSTRLTRSGAVLGTPRYMAPEQIFGERVDHRADIWALGVLAYELLSGRCPIQGTNLGEIMSYMRALPIEPIARVVPTLPPDIATLIVRSLSKNPSQRPQVVSEIGAAFAKFAT